MLKIFTKLFGGIEVRHKQLVLAGLLGSFITGIISIVLMQIVYNPTIKKTFWR